MKQQQATPVQTSEWKPLAGCSPFETPDIPEISRAKGFALRKAPAASALGTHGTSCGQGATGTPGVG